MLVSVIVPAYKQEKTIQEDILNISNAMSQTRWDYEIVVVVDGFLDNTFEEAKQLESEKIRILGYSENCGKGYAVRYGMSHARGDYIVFIDSGMEINPNGISMLLEHLVWYDADAVVGSKRHPASKVNLSWIRRIYSEGYYLLVKFLFRLKVRDTQAGLKVFKREVLEKVLPRLLVKEFAFDIEILAVARYLGFDKICEAPVEISLDFGATSKIDAFLFLNPSIRSMMIDTLAIFYRLYILRHYADGNEEKWLKHENLRMQYIQNGKSLPKFSVVIPVRTINDYLKETITHLEELDYPNFEVIVITDTWEQYPTDSRFRFLASGPRGPGEKRNIGAIAAVGDILAFLDDDAYPDADWLIHASQIFSNYDIYALGAPAVTPLDAAFFEKISGRVLESFLTSAGTVYRHVPRTRRLINDYPTVNLFVRKRAFLEIGGFSTEFWPGEDTKLCLDLVKKFGKRFLYDPKPIVYHHRRDTFLGHFKQISRFGQHRGQFAKIFPETSRLPSYFVPSFFVLGVILGPLISFFFPMLWQLYFGVLLVYFWLLLIEGAIASKKERDFSVLVYVVVGIFLTHLVYGVNFIIGYLKRPKFELKRVDVATGNYVGG